MIIIKFIKLLIFVLGVTIFILVLYGIFFWQIEYAVAMSLVIFTIIDRLLDFTERLAYYGYLNLLTDSEKEIFKIIKEKGSKSLEELSTHTRKSKIDVFRMCENLVRKEILTTKQEYKDGMIITLYELRY